DLQVTTTPDAIPEHIEVDISELAIGDSYLVGDLDATDKYAIENDKEEAVVTVVPPTEEPAEDAEETAAEDADAVSQEAEKEEKEKDYCLNHLKGVWDISMSQTLFCLNL